MDIRNRTSGKQGEREPLLHDSIDPEVAKRENQSPSKSSPQSCSVVMEPLVFLYSMSTLPIDALRTQFLYQKVQQHLNVSLINDSNVHNCDINQSDAIYVLRERVQAEASQWLMYLSLAQIVPSFFMALFCGIYSDRIGRKAALVMPPIGCLLSILGDMAVITFDLPIYFLFFEVVEYFFGGRYAVVSVVFAYISDTTTKESKDLRMAIVDTIWLLTSGLMNLAVGFLIKSHGYIACFYFLAFGQILSLLYILLFVPELIPDQTSKRQIQIQTEGETPSNDTSLPARSKKKRLTFDQLMIGASVFLRDNGSGRRWKLIILLAAYCIDRLIRGHKVVNLYVLNSPLCWNSVLIGYYGAAENIVRCIGGLILVVILRKCLSADTIALVAKLQVIAEYTYMAFVSSTMMMFFSPLIGCMGFTAVPMIRALMSNLVEPYEQGTMFAVMTGVSNIANLFSLVAVNKIYQSTLFFLPGFIFLCKALVAGISFVLIVIYAVISRLKSSKSSSDQIVDSP